MSRRHAALGQNRHIGSYTPYTTPVDANEVDSRQYHLDAKGYEKTVTKHTRMTLAGIKVLHWLPNTIRDDGNSVISDLRVAVADGNERPKLPIRTVRMR